MKTDKKIEMGRLQGLDYALRIIKKAENMEQGVKNLEQEIKVRGAKFIPLEIRAEDLDNALEGIKQNCVETVTLMAMTVLRDEFDFGTKRLARFMKTFVHKTECLTEGYIWWDELQDVIRTECKLDVPLNDEISKMERVIRR